MRPEKLFLVLSLFLGLVFTASSAPNRTPDEMNHFIRAFEVSEGRIFGDVVMPIGLYEFWSHVGSKLARFKQEPETKFYKPEFFSLSDNFDMDKDRLYIDIIKAPQITGNNPLPYIPAALAFKISTLAELKPLYVLYMIRVINLFLAVTIIYYAIKTTPAYKWLMAYIALLPTAVFLRSSAGVDGITFAVSLLFFSHIIKANSLNEPLIGRELIVLSILSFVAAQSKSGYILLPFIALMIPSCRFSGLRDRLFKSSIIILPAVIACAMWIISVRYFLYSGEAPIIARPEAMPDLQIRYMLEAPITYIKTLFSSIFSGYSLFNHPKEFLGVFGWLDVHLNSEIYALLFAGLLFMILFGNGEQIISLNLTQKVIMQGIFWASIALMYTMLYIQWNPVASGFIGGFQGRYLYPIAMLLFLALPQIVNQYSNQTKALIIFAICSYSCLTGALNQIVYDFNLMN